jgi:molybdopterin-guanine dinucleotide biosynthesis protein
MRVIRKGLDPGDWVVVEGLQRATPGTRVAVTRKKAQPPVAPKTDASAAQ